MIPLTIHSHMLGVLQRAPIHFTLDDAMVKRCVRCQQRLDTTRQSRAKYCPPGHCRQKARALFQGWCDMRRSTPGQETRL